MTSRIEHQQEVPQSLALDRLDHVAAILFPQYSRARLQNWIKSGELTVDGQLCKSKAKVFGGEQLVISALADEINNVAQDIALDIVYEDAAILVVNKPANLVVHPGAGHQEGTLLNALLHHDGKLAEVPRAGIVHRLDKDTTGLMVVAKTIISQNELVKQLQSRSVRRLYEAIVYGVPHRDGTVDQPINRHATQRTRMAVREGGKQAITDYNVIKRYTSHAHMAFSLRTGRTHQIRVHMQYLGYPLVGDPVYGGHLKIPKGASQFLISQLQGFSRQALHAKQLSFIHPDSHELVSFSNDTPADIMQLLSALEENEQTCD